MNRILFRVLHCATFLLGLSVCVVLFHARGGHPPGIVFLPFAAAAWVFLHIFLGVIQKLGSMGVDRAYAAGMEPEPWPLALILVVVGCCMIFVNGLTGIAPLILYRNLYPIALILFLAVQLTNLACLCGVLLRRDWARIIAGVVLMLIAALILFRLAPVLLWGKGLGFVALSYAAALIAASSGLGYYLLTSERIRNFFIR